MNKHFSNILSLFDGISCGQIALNRANITYDNYYSSEVDVNAIKITQKNFPKTIQLGDITKISGENLPNIDFLMGGSPCQGFSVAGKQLNFNDPRSKLFFEFVRLKNELKPTYFLLENVVMKKEYENIITEYIGVEPVKINSCLVSAQNRNRLYWANFKIEQPVDKDIKLKSILEDCVGGEKILFNEYGECVFDAKNGKKIRLNNKVNLPYTIYESRTEFGKSERKRLRKLLGKDTTPRSKEHKEYLPLKTNKANCVLTCETTLDYILDENLFFRTYTTKELERLQTIPEDYIGNLVSARQARKMIGNGWTVSVIEHILNEIFK